MVRIWPNLFVKISDKIFGNIEKPSYISFVVRDKDLKHKTYEYHKNKQFNGY